MGIFKRYPRGQAQDSCAAIHMIRPTLYGIQTVRMETACLIHTIKSVYRLICVLRFRSQSQAFALGRRVTYTSPCFTNHLHFGVSLPVVSWLDRGPPYQQVSFHSAEGSVSSSSKLRKRVGINFDISIQLRSMNLFSTLCAICGQKHCCWKFWVDFPYLLLPRHMRAPEPKAKKKRSRGKSVLGRYAYTHWRGTHIASLSQPAFRIERFHIFAKDFCIPVHDPWVDTDHYLVKLSSE